MNTVNVLLSNNPDFKLVQVIFNSDAMSKTYTYKTLLDFEVNDLAVVFANGQYKVVQVVKVMDFSEFSGNYNLKWIADKVDTSHLEKCEEMEASVTKEVNKLHFEKTREEYNQMLTKTLGEDAVKTIKGLVRL